MTMKWERVLYPANSDICVRKWNHTILGYYFVIKHMPDNSLILETVDESGLMVAYKTTTPELIKDLLVHLKILTPERKKLLHRRIWEKIRYGFYSIFDG